MKTDVEIKEAMENIKTQLTRSTGDSIIMLQGQFAALEWALDEQEKKDES